MGDIVNWMLFFWLSIIGSIIGAWLTRHFGVSGDWGWVIGNSLGYITGYCAGRMRTIDKPSEITPNQARS